MPRFLLLVLLTAAAHAAAPLAPPERACDLVAETVIVHRRGDQMDLYLQATVATDADRGALVYAFPAGAAQGGSTFHPATLVNFSHQIEPRPKYVLGTLKQALTKRELGPFEAAMPDQPVHRVAPPDDVSLLPADRLGKRGGVTKWLAEQGLAADEAFGQWLTRQQQAGRDIWALGFATRATDGMQALELPPLRVTYASEEALVPFSQPQGGDTSRANATERPYRLAIFADQRLAPNYPDGYPIFSDLALQYAYRLSDEAWTQASRVAPLGPPERGGADYLSYWEANVPSTARADEIVLVPQAGPEVPPTQVVTPEVLVPIPVDLLVVVLLFLLVAAILVRRRSRGRTSSAAAPVPPDSEA